MPPLQLLIGGAAGIISIAGFVPYARSAIRGGARPSYATWLVWTVVGILLFASYDAGVGGTARWVPLTDALGPAAIAAIAWRYRQSELSRLERGCLVLAGLSVVAWVLTGSPLSTLTINLFIAFIGALPTLWKTYRDPGGESILAWRLFFAANTLNLAAIGVWDLRTAAYPVYAVVIAGIMNVLLSTRRFVISRQPCIGANHGSELFVLVGSGSETISHL
jgi:hypothetical protein